MVSPFFPILPVILRREFRDVADILDLLDFQIPVVRIPREGHAPTCRKDLDVVSCMRAVVFACRVIRADRVQIAVERGIHPVFLQIDHAYLCGSQSGQTGENRRIRHLCVPIRHLDPTCQDRPVRAMIGSAAVPMVECESRGEIAARSDFDRHGVSLVYGVSRGLLCLLNGAKGSVYAAVAVRLHISVYINPSVCHGFSPCLFCLRTVLQL